VDIEIQVVCHSEENSIMHGGVFPDVKVGFTLKTIAPPGAKTFCGNVGFKVTGLLQI
jgi:hypothetical protein